MTIDPNSFAAGVGVAVDNKQFAVAVEVLERKHLIVGSYDTAITTIVDNVPAQIASPDAAGDLYGFGSQLHRMAIAAYAGHNFDVPVWALPAPEDVSAVQATGSIAFTVGPAGEAGTMHIYIAGIYVPVAVAKGDTITEIGDALDAAILANPDLPVTSTNTAGSVAITAKTGGTFGNDISLTMNWGVGEETVDAVTVTITPMSSGATDPDIDDALDGIGIGAAANESHFTDVNFGWGFDVSATIDAISIYNGVGNQKVGLYEPTLARPFRNLWGDTTPDAAGKTALIAIANAHRFDRTSGVIAAPGSPVHPVELATQTMGILAKLNSSRAEQTAINQTLTGVIPGLSADMWTVDYNERDDAVKNGVGTTLLKSGVLTVQNVLTFYRPASVPLSSNGYRSQRNISIIQNMLNAVRVNFENEKWNGVSIVVDVAKVSNALDRAKARDIAAVIDDLLAIAEGFGSRAWIYSAAWTKEQLSAGGLVSIRSGANGFDCTLPVLLSGEAGIYNTVIEFDTSLAVLLG